MRVVSICNTFDIYSAQINIPPPFPIGTGEFLITFLYLTIDTFNLICSILLFFLAIGITIGVIGGILIILMAIILVITFSHVKKKHQEDLAFL